MVLSTYMAQVDIVRNHEFTGNKYLSENATESLRKVGGQTLVATDLTRAMGELHGFEDRPRFLYDVMGMLAVYDVRTHMNAAKVTEVFYDEAGVIGLKIEGETDVQAVIIQPQDENSEWGRVTVIEKNNFYMAAPGAKDNEVAFYRNWDLASLKETEHTSAMITKLGVVIDDLNFINLE